MKAVFKEPTHNPAEDRVSVLVDALIDMARVAIVHSVLDVEQSARQRKWARERVAAARREYAGVLPDLEGFVSSLAARDHRWRGQFDAWAAELPGEWLPRLEVVLSLNWPIDEEFPLGGGPHQRRLDAILDLLETPASASDIQEVYLEAVDQLGEASKNYLGSITTEVLGALARGATSVYFYDDNLGRAAEQGVRTIGESMNSGLGGEIIDGIAFPYTVRDLAAAEGRTDVVDQIDAHFLESYAEIVAEIGEVKRNGQALDGREGLRRMLKQTLDTLEIAPPTSAEPIEVVGLRLSDARAVLGLHGHTIVAEEDIARPTGEGRTAWKETGWIVSQQSNDGSHYTVGIHKPYETVVRSILD